MGNSCNHEHEEEIEEDTICWTRRRGRYFPKYILGRVSVITVISSYLEFKGYSAVPELICRTQITEITGSTDSTQHHTYKDYVYLDRSLLSNLTWRRAHVTAGLTGSRGSKCKCKCFAAFSLSTKSSSLICIYGDCNAILLFTSRLLCAFEIRLVLVYQDKWFVSVSN